MEKKKILFIILCVIVLAVFITIALYYFRDKRIYTLNLPQPENLESITLKQNDNQKNINENKEINEILEKLNGEKRTTKEESIQDAPVNANNVITVNFNFKEAGASTIFIYNKNNKYYLEQPYNGIYQMTEEEYSEIEKLIK